MTLYTLVVSPTAVVVYDGQVEGSVLRYSSPTMKIYVHGRFRAAIRSTVQYHAFELFRACHIGLHEVEGHWKDDK